MSGMSFHKHSMKVMQINSCLFYAKGMAEYVFILDLDELFLPKGKNFNFLDVFTAMTPKEDLLPFASLGTSTTQIWRDKVQAGGKGWASGHAHPSCYITVSSDVMLNPQKGGYFDTEHPWVGQR
jgi:Glycosyltransferase family 92